MGAQVVKEMSVLDVQRLIAKGKNVGGNSYAIPSMNVTLTIREKTRPGYVRVFVTQGCVC